MARFLILLLSLGVLLGILMLLSNAAAAFGRAIGSAVSGVARAIGHAMAAVGGAVALSLASGLIVSALVSQNSDLDPVLCGILGTVLVLPLALIGVRRFLIAPETKKRLAVADLSEKCSPSPADASPATSKVPLASSRSPDDENPGRATAKGSRLSWSIFRRGREDASEPSEVEEPALRDAWETATTRVDWAGSRIGSARASCTRLLRQAAADPMDLETLEWATLIRNQVPALVTSCLGQCTEATPSERESLMEALVETLETIGAEADRRRKTSRRSTGSAFDVQRAHIAERARSGRDWLRF